MSDKPIIELVHGLNINLFAYYAQSAKTDKLGKSDITLEQFQNIYQPILNQFAKQFGTSEKPADFSHQLITKDSPEQTVQPLLLNKSYLFWSSHTKNNHPDKPKPLYNLLFYPQKLDGDTYALLLNIFRPQQSGYDQVLVEEFKKFYPLSLPKSNTFIGQTILVTAFLPESADIGQTNLKTIADFLREKLFADQLPKFYQDGYILGSYICEYSQPKQRGDRLLIILYLTETTPRKIKKIYLQLPELFVAYHKITYTFQSSRIWHEQANQKVSEIEELLRDKIKTLQTGQDQTNIDLNTLNQTLEKLLEASLNHALQLRKLDSALNTIQIHQNNYQTTLQEFQKITDDQLEFLANFLDQSIFTNQIEADLNYLKPVSYLLDQSINTIRGIVEVEQTKSDRSLEKTIQILGVGLGVGGIVSSTISGYIQEPISLVPNLSKPIHPGVFSLLISLLLGGLAALIMKAFIDHPSLLAKIKKIFNKRSNN